MARAGADTQRRLAAFMFVDVVGYTPLAQRDEELALDLVRELQGFLQSTYERYHGKQVKSLGDGFLVEFASAVDAARCAVNVQRELATRNAGESRERRISVRIGLHLADVMVSSGDVHGAGINLAARIYTLGEPGGVVASADVARQLASQSDVRAERWGKRRVKGVAAPVELYRICCESPARSAALKNPRHPDRGTLAAVLVILAAVGIVYASLSARSPALSHSAGSILGGLQPDPVGVPASGDDLDLVLGEGIGYLSRREHPWVDLAIQRFSQASRKDPHSGSPHAWLAIAKTILVNYGWCGGTPAARKCAAEAESEAKSARRLGPDLPETHAALAGVSFFLRFDWAAAGQEFRQFVRLERPSPRSTLRYATLHQWYSLYLTARGEFAKAEREVQVAAKQDSTSPSVQSASGIVAYYAREWPLAEQRFRLLVEARPPYPQAHLWLGKVYAAEGRYQDAIKEFSRTPDSDVPGTKSMTAYCLARTGVRRAAVAYLHSGAGTAFDRARVLASLGRGAESVDALNAARNQRVGDVLFLGVDPLFDSLRHLRGFQRVLADVAGGDQ